MAARFTRPDGSDLSQMRPVRSPSFSSDVMSSSARSAGTMPLVPHANPPPAYIARTEASDLLTAELDRRVDVSPAALTLLNEFLDHVLYSIISISHSVALGQLKAAVPAVLKPRLGKAALRVAEEELKEYMEDEEAEELYTSRHAIQPKVDFDHELVWKLARLRCMVYARMGDLEEEDEEEWLEKERLLDAAAASPMNTRQSMAVTPGSAIFLTSVIEYLGEQALYYAAQYAQKRHDNAWNQDLSTPTDKTQLGTRNMDILLDGRDMNHVGRDSPLSRLWRSWRRNTREPIDGASRSMSPDASFLSPAADSLHSHTTSSAHASIPPIPEESRRLQHERSAAGTPLQIPLPVSDRDVEEIEGADTLESFKPENGARRPVSMPAMPGEFPSYAENTTTEAPEFRERSPLRPRFDRNRSSSLPVPQTPFAMPEAQDDESMILPIQNGVDEDARENKQDQSQEPERNTVEDVSTENQKEDSTAGRQVKSAEKAITVRQKSTSTPEQFNTTVAAIAGALSAVGVHHAQNKNLQNDRPQNPLRQESSSSEKVVISASIKGRKDFDMMYVPEGRLSPEEQEAKRAGKSITQQQLVEPGQPYYESADKPHEDHKRYSLQAHEMDTPSIHTHRKHSPRFPRDMRSTSPQSDTSDRPISNYVLAPETNLARGAEPSSTRNVAPVNAAVTLHRTEIDSPVSPGSNRTSTKPAPALSEVAPELPQYAQLVDEYTAGRLRGHSKSSSSSSRLLGFTRDPAGRPQTIYQQRAAGDVSDDIRRAHSSTPDGMNRQRRAESRPIISTADSPESPQRRQHLRIQSDSDNNLLQTGPNDETTERSLEVLINSNETLHYTLTPATANFRDEDTSPKRSDTQELADFFRNTAPPGQGITTSKTNRSRRTSMDTNRIPQVAQPSPAQRIVPTSRGVPEKPAVLKSKNSLGEPRDAKVERSTGVRDLADYMRSTGPATEDQLPKALPIRAPVATSINRRGSATSPTITSPQSPPKAASRLKFQARDARTTRNAESSALIDFIREGPPREAGDHRINRHIAPFRTTMDSDDLNALVSSIPKDSSDTNGFRSIDTGNNSTTPLINHDKQSLRSPPSKPTLPQVSNLNADDGMPKKTRNRVKDPYAIDDSDDELFQEPAPKQTNEESLIDFLRNTAPSQNMTAQPILSSPYQVKPSLYRTPSVDKLKDLVRGTRERSMTPAPSTAPLQAQERIQAQSRARAESPHLTQIGTKKDSFRPTKPTYASHVNRNRGNNHNSHRNVGATADLADYLKKTGPPPSNDAAPAPFILTKKQVNGVKKDEGGLKKFFSRKGRS